MSQTWIKNGSIEIKLKTLLKATAMTNLIKELEKANKYFGDILLGEGHFGLLRGIRPTQALSKINTLAPKKIKNIFKIQISFDKNKT